MPRNILPAWMVADNSNAKSVRWIEAASGSVQAALGPQPIKTSKPTPRLLDGMRRPEAGT